MSHGIYTVEFSAQDLTAADGNMDIFEFRPGTTSGLPIHLVALDVMATSEIGDAQEEMLHFSVLRMTGGTFTSGTGGTTPTPVPVTFGDPASEFAADCVNDAVATTTGTTVNLMQSGFNVRVGLERVFPPEFRFTAPPVAQAALLVRINTTVADTITLQGTAWIEEG